MLLEAAEQKRTLDLLANPAGDTQARRIEQAQRNAEIIQRVNPDVLLLNEFDYVSGQAGNEAIDLFRTNFLSVPQTIPAYRAWA